MRRHNRVKKIIGVLKVSHWNSLSLDLSRDKIKILQYKPTRRI